ncbi:MAG: tRNA preQ1(34) S-adenosylmethionine ribosyltransferase-isomerase QueA [Planctomycetota bacterium]
MTRTTKTEGIPPADDRQGADSISNYDFDLPEHLIAQEPATERSASRCLFCRRGVTGGVTDDFRNFSEKLDGSELLVVNDTRVIPARIRCHRQSGGAIEVFLLKPLKDDRCWQAWLSPARRIRPGEILKTSGPDLKVIDRSGSGWKVELGGDAVLEEIGEIPLPPYIHRNSTSDDRNLELTNDEERYQTVFARTPGAVAAPTAGLHFDATVLADLEKKGIPLVSVTLHVGPGTFKPVEADRISDHRVLPEWYSVSSESRMALTQARSSGRRIIAVGTTSLRVLESLGPLIEGPTIEAETDLTILPGHSFSNVDGLVTNFHLPRSSLLVLVSSFHGHANTMALYQQAIEANFRFYSYGDCMAILPENRR